LQINSKFELKGEDEKIVKFIDPFKFIVRFKRSTHSSYF